MDQKSEPIKPKTGYASDWASTHVCKGERADCPCLYIHYGEDGGTLADFPGKKLEKYRVYCTTDGKLRTISANLATWTGLTPKWCPIRKKWEAEHGQE